jgi:glycosyltransferase involved in cell wall biosynthesis
LSAHAPHKNFPHLIHCFAALVESGELTDASLVIAGPNPQRNSAARATVEKYPRLKPRIVLAGRVADEDLAALYSGATAFLFPSFCEGFGIPTLEAMQCGTPVISSNTTSMPEVIGDAGLLVPPQDQDAWCQAMLELARQPALRETFRKKSLQRARLFTWQKFLDQTLLGYRTALAESRPNRQAFRCQHDGSATSSNPFEELRIDPTSQTHKPDVASRHGVG